MPSISVVNTARMPFSDDRAALHAHGERDRSESKSFIKPITVVTIYPRPYAEIIEST